MALLGLIPSSKSNEIELLRKQVEELNLRLYEGKNKKIHDKLIFEWRTESRSFVQRRKSWFIMIAFIAMLFIMLFAIMGQLLVILMICAFLLMVYAISAIPADEVNHKITTSGVYYIDRVYKWKELDKFWFTQKDTGLMLNINSKIKIPAQLILKINSYRDKEFITSILDEYLERIDLKEKNGQIIQNPISKLADGRLIRY